MDLNKPQGLGTQLLKMPFFSWVFLIPKQIPLYLFTTKDQLSIIFWFMLMTL